MFISSRFTIEFDIKWDISLIRVWWFVSLLITTLKALCFIDNFLLIFVAFMRVRWILNAIENWNTKSENSFDRVFWSCKMICFIVMQFYYCIAVHIRLILNMKLNKTIALSNKDIRYVLFENSIVLWKNLYRFYDKFKDHFSALRNFISREYFKTRCWFEEINRRRNSKLRNESNLFIIRS